MHVSLVLNFAFCYHNQVQQLRAVEAPVPLHREVAVVARRLAAPLGGDRRNGRLGSGRGLLGGGRAARLADRRAGASGAVNDCWSIGRFKVQRLYPFFRTNAGHEQGRASGRGGRVQKFLGHCAEQPGTHGHRGRVFQLPIEGYSILICRIFDKFL